MHVKRLFLAVVIALLLPVAVFANSSVDFTNSGGTLSGNNSGLSLSNSTLTSVNGLSGGGLITGNLGSIAFSTGGLSSGSLAMGGTFAGGGSFTITGNGTNGIPNGVIFAGTFNGPVTWTLVTLSDGTHSYTLTGVLAGSLLGVPTNGVTVQLTVNTGTGFFNGSATLGSGDTNIQVVPEPNTLSLFASGMFGLAVMLRTRLRK
jgi:hypothetical protein